MTQYILYIYCSIIGHRWVKEDTHKRYCAVCSQRQWVFENRYPAIGIPKYEWKDVGKP